MKGRANIDLSPAIQTADVDDLAEQLVAKAASASFPLDPLIGADLSHSISTVSSVVRRHGYMIQAELARALQSTGRFHVETNFPAQLPNGRILSLDLLVIEPEIGWAGGYEVKRGLGATEGSKRRQLQEDLKALRQALPQIAAELGYGAIDHSTSAVISYFDNAVFSAELILRRDDLDGHFQAPVVARVDAMTEAVGRSLRRAVPRLFAAVPPAPPPRQAETPRRELLHARPLGPGEVRRLIDQRRWPPR